jgi:holliday junction DNA helicase RuvB
MSDRLINPQLKDEEKVLDLTLRPKKLDDFVGQDRVKNNLNILMVAAKQRLEPIEHVLLYGAPGLGKTTLANIIAREMNANIRTTSGPAIERAGDLAAILSNLEDGDVLFIDEIHRLNKSIEEILYPAMEDYALDIIVGKGPSARTLRLDLPRFTLVGATTKLSHLTSPLRDRFGGVWRLDFYTAQNISHIVNRSANILGVKLTQQAAHEIAQRSRQTPRIANRILKRVRDFAQVKGNGQVTHELCLESMQLLEIDRLGLDEIDRRLLSIMIDKFAGGPVGLNSLAASTGEEMATIEEVYEPFLMQIGFLTRTPRGRVVTPAGYDHLGVNPIPSARGSGLANGQEEIFNN